MGLLNKQNKKDVIHLDFKVRVTFGNNLWISGEKTLRIKNEVNDFLNIHVLDALASRKYMKQQIISIWMNVCDEVELKKYDIIWEKPQNNYFSFRLRGLFKRGFRNVMTINIAARDNYTLIKLWEVYGSIK